MPAGPSALVGVSSKRWTPRGRLETPSESARGEIVVLGESLYLLVDRSG